jgi:asparagine synthase (glutamine-hydrolysing)
VINGLKRLEQLSKIDPRASILRWGSYFSPEWKQLLWREPLLDQAESLLIDKFDHSLASNFLDQTLASDMLTYLPGDLLVKADRMTMANSLEGRSPFLDHKLAEWAACLPTNMKVRGFTGKYILRKTFQNKLPRSIYKRGKQGFGIPVDTWFRGPLAWWANNMVLGKDKLLYSWFNPSTLRMLLDEHINGRVNHGKRIYALVMLSLWLESV